MRITIQPLTSITCDDLTVLLGLPVRSITRGVIDAEGTRGVLVTLDATAAQITADHEAVLIDVFGAGEIVVEAAG